MDRRFLDLVWRSALGVPLAIALVGVGLTLLAVVVQGVAAERAASQRFDADVAAVEDAIERGIAEQVERFQSSLNFVEATHPGDPAEFEAFFRRESPHTIDGDPGVLLVEVIDRDDLTGVEDRERELRGEDFTIFDLSRDADEKLIVTRASNDVGVLGFSLLGMDVTAFEQTIVPGGLPEEGTAVRLIESAQLFGLAGVSTTLAEDADPTVFMVLAPVGAPGGDFYGALVDFVAVEDLLAPVEAAWRPTFDVSFQVEGVEEPVARLSEGSSLTGRQSVRTGVTNTLRWSATIVATDAYEQDVVPIDRTNTWLLGLGLTSIASLMVLTSNHLRTRLYETSFELEHARALASTDALTGLLNRKGMIDAAREDDVRQAACVYFVDLDGFKAVNDESGHDEGDRVLRTVANRLTGIFRPGDLVCRLGGDEFVIYSLGITSAARIREVSNEITEAVAAIDDRITSSVGVAVRPLGLTIDVKELLRSADRAMYEAKRSGGNGYTLARDAA